MSELYNTIDYGEIVDEVNQAVAVYQYGTIIPMRSQGWGKFALDLTLVASKVRIKARASKDTSTYNNATQTLFGTTEITSSGYYELTDPTEAKDIQIEWETTNTTNTTKIALLVMRPT
jgi:hypothetical protein